MRLLIVSVEPQALVWAHQLNSASLSTVVCNTYADAVDKSNNTDILILDYPAAKEYVVANMKRTVQPGIDVYIRFEPSTYNTTSYEAIIAAGVKGMFLGWPTVPILENELLVRIGVVKLVHASLGTIVLDLDNYLQIGYQDKIKLTPKEAKILRRIMRASGEVVTTSALLKALGYKTDTNTHTLETHIYRMRLKLNKDTPALVGSLIETRDRGYALAT